MQNALQEDGLASGIQVVNIPGAGGTIGLAQFVSGKEGQGDALMTGGLVMLGAILTNESPVTLEQVTPIARLTGEYEVIVVPSSSEIQTLDDLIAKFKEDPQSVSWGGGSAGGTDHMLVGLIAKEAGVDPDGINYVPFAGGGEALASILGGHVSAGVSGYQEFAGQIETGDLRALAISSAERLDGVDIPTLKEQGVDVELTNWRAVFAPPGHLGRGQAGAGRRGRPDGRERGLAEHAQGARLARPLSAAGRVRGVPGGGPGAGRDRPQGHRPRAVADAPAGDGAMRGLRLGEAVLAAFVLAARRVRRRGDGDAAHRAGLFRDRAEAVPVAGRGRPAAGRRGAAVRGARRRGGAARGLRARPAAAARGDGAGSCCRWS